MACEPDPVELAACRERTGWPGRCQLSGCTLAASSVAAAKSSRAFDLIPYEVVNELRHFFWADRTMTAPGPGWLGDGVQSDNGPCFERAPHPHDEAASIMTLPDEERTLLKQPPCFTRPPLYAAVRVPTGHDESSRLHPRAQPGELLGQAPADDLS
ncbi:hypothetical protein BU25DRAFT_464079 [Macroventuria anomochaeta]|uniref:Uncharacterized protein n=1 Tax=Macroventuria anomochaeta TaxID=301207 RepID=A0ACB6SFR5_9PLEO|nr:uncharacterized protein BU25DRAFT_464079 [Macroventuria anomochaeta]KAF2633171.1 hypothetical protein BU25DRAFT_464079 [Macroventuria anomochaeta]